MAITEDAAVGITLFAHPDLRVEALDLSSDQVDFVQLNLGPLQVLGSADEIRYLLTRGLGQLDKVDASRVMDREKRCVDGTHSHPLSLLEDLGDGRTAVECLACDRSFVQEGDGRLSPIVSGVAVGP